MLWGSGGGMGQGCCLVRFQMDAKSYEATWVEVREMWFWKWKSMALAAAVSPEGGGCESQKLINAQRRVLTGREEGLDLRAAAQEVVGGFGNGLDEERGMDP